VRLYNTLSGKVEEFQPLEPATAGKPGRVRMYTCGPTVYDYAHIGNFRTFVFQDILRRTLRLRGYELLHVMNITDVDDKTIRNASEAGMSLREYTDKYTQAFWQDARLLNLETPEIVARATDHIPDMAALIGRLLEKGIAYRAPQGAGDSIYFRISQFPTYGQLSKIDLSGIQAGARVDVEEYEKTDPRDFALWKASKPGEPVWETPIGRGRPGWHIECSAMSMKYLGETFDIHTGGVDLIFPHHTNEIAQSEAATGKPFVRTWLHAEHLIVEGEKMSKSLGNFYTLRDLLAKGHKPSAIRFLLASVPYRRQLNFTFDGLHQAAQSVERLRNFRLRLHTERFPGGSASTLAELAARAVGEFDEALDNDLNTAEALAALFNLVRDANTAMDQGKFHQGDVPAIEKVLERFDQVFAVLRDDDYEKLAALKDELAVPVPVGVDGITDEEVDNLLRERAQARARRDFARSDQIRRELTERGIMVEDTKDGVRWKRK
jgi:cysteinyl-tRNA synthetase